MADLYFRPQTWDRSIWQSVFDHDEYGLGKFAFDPSDAVLDVGAHVGAFTYTVLGRGAGFVVACEPDVSNFHLLQHNLHQACAATDRALLLPCACWRSGEGRVPTVRFAGVGQNTGGGSTLGGDGVAVAALGLDDLVELALRWSGRSTVRLLKLDCEGAEWAILHTARTLLRIDAIVGEYHELPGGVGGPGEPSTRQDLSALLSRRGFEVRLDDGPSPIGRFAAWRPGREPFA